MNYRRILHKFYIAHMILTCSHVATASQRFNLKDKPSSSPVLGSFCSKCLTTVSERTHNKMHPGTENTHFQQTIHISSNFMGHNFLEGNNVNKITAHTESLPILGQCHWGIAVKPHNGPCPLQLVNLIHLHSARY